MRTGFFIGVEDTSPSRAGLMDPGNPPAQRGRRISGEQHQNHRAWQRDRDPGRSPHPHFCKGQNKGKNSKQILRLWTSTMQTEQMILWWSGADTQLLPFPFSPLDKLIPCQKPNSRERVGASDGSQGNGITPKFNLQIYLELFSGTKKFKNYLKVSNG